LISLGSPPTSDACPNAGLERTDQPGLLAIRDEMALVDATVYVQGMFVDVANTPADDIRLTNALKIEIGAP
jgi:hypothetical protein